MICKLVGEVRKRGKYARSSKMFATRTWPCELLSFFPYRFDRNLACRALRWPKVKDVVGESRRLPTLASVRLEGSARLAIRHRAERIPQKGRRL